MTVTKTNQTNRTIDMMGPAETPLKGDREQVTPRQRSSHPLTTAQRTQPEIGTLNPPQPSPSPLSPPVRSIAKPAQADTRRSRKTAQAMSCGVVPIPLTCRRMKLVEVVLPSDLFSRLRRE
ncbi:hypothetical protein JZ751_029074 [Albula glossodonta]|uniref:Uncharacterized protein n=1 Tax=Albula glossodonta TaxID=121402 RepID=A0A8T2PIS4_9TELE|nr:hypothetical protein JZ751_029074 [Albula glossodonta]